MDVSFLFRFAKLKRGLFAVEINKLFGFFVFGGVDELFGLAPFCQNSRGDENYLVGNSLCLGNRMGD